MKLDRALNFFTSIHLNSILKLLFPLIPFPSSSLRLTKLYPSRLVTFGECTILSGPLSSAIHPWVAEYWRWFWPPLGRNGEFCVAVGPVTYMTAGIMTNNRMVAYSDLTLASSKVKYPVLYNFRGYSL